MFYDLLLFNVNISNFLLKYILKQDIPEDKQVFDRVDLDDYLKNVKSSDDTLDNRVEVEMLQNAWVDLNEESQRMYDTKNRNRCY